MRFQPLDSASRARFLHAQQVPVPEIPSLPGPPPPQLERASGDDWPILSGVPSTCGTKVGPLPHASSAWNIGSVSWRGPVKHQWDPEHGTVPDECTRCLGKASPRKPGLGGGVSLQSGREGSLRDQQVQGTDPRKHGMFGDLGAVQGVPGTPIQCRNWGRWATEGRLG